MEANGSQAGSVAIVWARIAAGIVGVALLVPLAPASAGTLGIPLTTTLEYAGVGLCLAVLMMPRMVSRLIVVLAISSLTFGALALAGKAIALTQPSASFAACYQVNSPRTEDVSRAGDCEKSYDAPLSTTLTREDAVIDFRSATEPSQPPVGIRDSNWDLSAFNALPYNYLTRAMAEQYGYPFEIDQNRLPVSAQWRGVLERSGPVTVTYVGEGEVIAGLRSTPLPASYPVAGQVIVDGQPGMVLGIDYRWQPGDLAAGPYASISVTGSDGLPIRAMAADLPPVGAPVASSSSSLAGMLPILISISLAVAFAGLAFIVIACLVNSRPTRRVPMGVIVVGVVLTAGWIAAMLGVWQLGWAIPALPVFLLLLLALVRVYLDAATTRLVAVLGISSTAIIACEIFVAGSGPLFYRPTGNDFFTYEAQARTILTSGSLQGGEDVFIYSGAMRYWLFLQHLVFGDGERGIFVLSIAMLLGATWFAVRRLAVDRIANSTSPFGHALQPSLVATLLAIVVVGVMIGTPFMWQGGYVLLSEYPTWIFLAIAFTLALTRTRPAEDVILGALLGLTILFRGNQLVGVLAVMAIGCARLCLPLIRDGRFGSGLLGTLRIIGPFLLVGSLSGLHNLVYGGRFVPLATSLPIPVNFPLPPERLMQLGTDPTVLETLVSQLKGVLVLVYPLELMPYGHFGAIVLVIQIALVIVLLIGLAHRLHGMWSRTLLTLLPVAFLLPHVFVQVYVYYPRHVIAGYFVGALVLVALAGYWVRAASAKPTAAEISG